MNDANEAVAFIKEWLGTTAAAGLALFLAWQKLWKGWAADRVVRVHDDAQATVVLGLQRETERLQAQNSSLATALNEMQLTAARIAGENLRLKTEIEQLQAQIQNLIEQLKGGGANHGRAEPV